MRFTRRAFMGAGLAGAGALAFPRRALAVPGDVNVVIMFAYGGWDPALSIDPKLQSAYIDAWDDPQFPSSIETFSGLDVLVSTRRPAVTAYFENFAGSTAIVRGIHVGSVAHHTGVVRMMTGTRTERSPDLGAIVAVNTGGDLPLPYTDLGGGALTGPYAASVGRVGASRQIITLIDRSKQAYEPAGVPDYTKDQIYAPDLNPSSPIVQYARARAEALLSGPAAAGENAARIDDYLDCFDRADQVRSNPTLKALKLGGGSTPQQIAMGVTLLKEGTSRAIFIDPNSGFDSHDNYSVEQNDQQDRYFTNLTLLVQQLKDAALIDKTVVVAISEMGRTPKWNSENKDGKDHWPVTSALVVGGPVKPGVYGGTDERFNARPIDLKTGKVVAKGATLDYARFVAGILRMCGVDPAPYLPSVPSLEGFIA